MSFGKGLVITVSLALLLNLSAMVKMPKTGKVPAHAQASTQVETKACASHFAYGQPTISAKGVPLCNKGYFVYYSNDRKVPLYAAEHLIAANMYGKHERDKQFHVDPRVDNPSTIEDYRNHETDKSKWFDKGHMAPAQDFATDTDQMHESFALTNVVPQDPDNNQKFWRKLEGYVRNWAKSRGELYVITGPIFDGPERTRGNGVSIPSKIFKVVLNKQTGETIAFVVKNAPVPYDIPEYIVSVSEVEAMTGIKFFPGGSGLNLNSKSRMWSKEPRR